MKVLVIGAEGAVGACLANSFVNAGCDVSVLLDDKKIPASIRSSVVAIDPNYLGDEIQKVDRVVFTQDFGFKKTNRDVSFMDKKVSSMADFIKVCDSSGVKKFVYVSSVHVLNASHLDSYIIARKKCSELVESTGNPNFRTVYVPPIFDSKWTGRLSMLNRLPTYMRLAIFPFISSLKAIVHADKVASEILRDEWPPFENDWIITIGQDTNPFYLVIKRTLDLFVALLLLASIWWILAIVALFVKLSSPGPVLFIQNRVGRNGVVFKCWKFRTMHLNVPQVGTHLMSENSVTKVGKILRKTKLDELPQIKNILLNEMSLIGPRPCLPSQTRLVELRTVNSIFTVKPGISGLAQINNIDMSNPELLVSVDYRYVRLRSLQLDLDLMLKTATGSGQGDPTMAGDTENPPANLHR